MYKVSVYAAPMPFPLNFTVHTWFVTEYAGKVDRYEVWAVLGRIGNKALYVNGLDPYEGFRKTFFDSIHNPKRKSEAYELMSWCGEAGTVAQALFQEVRNSLTTYPAPNHYRMWPGPNSNTYVAWVLQQVPEVSYRLPRSAVGKNYTF